MRGPLYLIFCAPCLACNPVETSASTRSLDELTAKVADLEQKLAELDAKAKTSEQRLSNIETRLSAAEATLATFTSLDLETRLGAAEAAIAAAASQESAQNADLLATQMSLQSLTTTVAGHTVDIQAINTTLASLNAFDVTAVQARLTTVEGDVGNLLTKTAAMTVSGSGVFFTGVNVYVRNGSGQSDCGGAEPPCNGTGNLIVGYAEAGTGPGTGSHNLLVGMEHNFSGWGSVAVGRAATIFDQAIALAGQTIRLDAVNSARVTGSTVQINGSAEVDIHGPLVKARGDAMVDVDGGIITLN